MTGAWDVRGLPFKLSPSPEQAWSLDQQAARLAASAVPHSDMFIDPRGGS
jgi:hypothetical protein